MKDMTSKGIILVSVKYQCQFLLDCNKISTIGFVLKM